MKAVMIGDKLYTEKEAKDLIRKDVVSILEKDKDYNYVLKNRVKNPKKVTAKMATNAMIERVVVESYNKLIKQ